MQTQATSATILVPIDFSELTTFAVSHAVNYAKLLQSQLILVHFLSKSHKEDNPETAIAREEASSKLQNISEQVFADSGVLCTIAVRIGDFKDAIGAMANEVQAGLVVMATKGIQGIQRWTGSNAIKVVLSGKEIPFVVVQGAPKVDSPEHVVLPFSFEAESRQKLGRVPLLAKLFDCVFHIVTEPAKDELIFSKIDTNVHYAKRYLEEHGCRFTVSQTPGDKPFHKELITFAAQKSADLIVIMSEEDHDFLEFFTGSHEQDIIANDSKIPVMVLNPKDTSRLNGAPMFF